MIRESFRFIILIIIIFIFIALSSFLVLSSDWTSQLIMQKPNINKLCNFFKYFKDLLLKHISLAFFTSLFLAVLFYINSSRLKLHFGFMKGIFVVAIWGLIFTLAFVFLLPSNTFLEQKKDLTNETSYNTLLHNNIDKLFTSSNVLTLNGTSIYYSFYESDNKSNKKIFSNVIVSQSDKENPNYNQIYLFKEANLINNKIILRDLKETISTHDNITKKPSLPVELDINHFINRFRSKEKVFSPPIESKEPSKKIKENLENQITFPLMVENEDSLIKSALVKSFNFDIINNYENYLNLQIVNVKNILAGDKIGGSWLKLLNFIIEIISIILILLAIGVIISTKNVPLLNFISSMITTTLLLIGLAYYFPLPEKIIKLISTEISFLPGIIVPGIVLIISSVLLILIAYIKYRNIKFTSGEGK